MAVTDWVLSAFWPGCAVDSPSESALYIRGSRIDAHREVLALAVGTGTSDPPTCYPPMWRLCTAGPS